MQPSDPLGMKGQKLHLDQQQKENRADDKRYPGDSIREESQPAPAQALRPREKLDKNIGRKLPPQIFLGFLRIAELRLELPVEHADLRGQHDEMHERIGMRNNENDRRQNKKGDKRQWHIAHKRQFNGIFQEKIFMCHGASRDADVNQYEEIAQPQTCADRGRVLDGFSERVEVMRLFGEFFDWVSVADQVRCGRIFVRHSCPPQPVVA